MKVSELIRPLIRARFIDKVKIMDGDKVVYEDEPRKNLIDRKIYNRDVRGSYTSDNRIVISLEPLFNRITDKAWRNFDPWECCGQDSFCKRNCHDKGGCTNGCIVPKLYSRLAQYEDIGLMPYQVEELVEKQNLNKPKEIKK